LELSIVIPTRDRRDVLAESLTRLGRQTGAGSGWEVVVVDDGSADGSPGLVRERGASFPVDLRVVSQDARGPAAARNRGLAAARGAACLFLGDDMWPVPDLVRRHRDFHAARPGREEALLGTVRWSAEPRPSELMRWAQDSGLMFELPARPGPVPAPGRFFYTANVSAKTELLRAQGGFDEGFPGAAVEDVELGLRLERAGLRLTYDPDAVVEHHHPMDLAGLLARMRAAGEGTALLVERLPEWPGPRPPGARHRARALALGAAAAARLRTPRVRRATWRFLCHEAHREAFWGAPPPEGSLLRIGGRLAALARRDPATTVRSPDRRG
jgi:GT2 family glycosyltransferase